MNNKEIEDYHNKITNMLEKEHGIKNDCKVKAIGYLDGDNYEKGTVPIGFIEKLKQVFHSGMVGLTLGFHECEFCIKQRIKNPATSSSTKHLKDKTNKIEYIFPEMIFHYIEKHNFKPCDEFIKFIINY